MKTIARISAVLLLTVALLAACQPQEVKKPPDQVTLQLNWHHGLDFTGYYVAEAQGFYADENIAIAMTEGGIGITPYEPLLNQTADFAVLGFREHLTALDLKAQLVAVAAMYQLSPVVLFALSDSGIQSPQDMVGRKVAVKAESWRQTIHKTLGGAGVDPADIIEVEIGPDEGIEMLYNGEVDVWTGYVLSEPIEAQMAGYNVNLIFPGEYIVSSYQGLLVIHRDTLDQHPDLVNRFVRASLRGWRYAIEHLDETAEVMAEWQPDSSPEYLQIALRELTPLVDTGVPIGWIDADRWQQKMGEVYSAEQPGYTMQFVSEE